MKQVWSNWSGSVSCTPSGYFYPNTESEIVELVKKNSSVGCSIRVVGAGHSFTPVVETDDIIISLENYSGITEMDKQSKTATVKAGTKIGDLTRELASEGFMMENMGDIDKQTIAGAISTGTHGTGIEFGVLSDQVIELTLISGNGDVIKCSENEMKDVFKSSQVSLGAMGILSEITLRVESATKLTINKTVENLNKCSELADKYKAENRHFEFFCFPYTEKAIVKKINKATDEQKRRSTSIDTSNIRSVLYNKTKKFCCETSMNFPPASSFMSKLSANLIQERSVTGPSHEIYPSVRTVRFNEMEYGVPSENGIEALHSVKRCIEEENWNVQFPIEFRFVKGDDIPLSPAYGRDTAFIAIHRYHKKPYKRLFDRLELLLRQYGGRPHWGKHHTLTASQLDDVYPEWDRFQEARGQLDPDNVFMTKYLEKLLIGN